MPESFFYYHSWRIVPFCHFDILLYLRAGIPVAGRMRLRHGDVTYGTNLDFLAQEQSRVMWKIDLSITPDISPSSEQEPPSRAGSLEA